MEKLAEWISNHQFPCITKQLFGFNCPFCGFQRSLIALLKGDICESVTLFPALIPLALTIIVFGCGRIFNVPSLKKLTGKENYDEKDIQELNELSVNALKNAQKKPIV